MVNQCEACVKGVVNPVHLHAHEVILEFFPGFTGPPSKSKKLNKHSSNVNKGCPREFLYTNGCISYYVIV